MAKQPVLISRVYQPDQTEWLLHCEKAKHTTFFHTPMWSEVFERTDRHFRSKPQCLQFNDGTTVLLPMVSKSILFGLSEVYLSMPACTYGGWVSAVALENSHIEAILKHISTYKNLICRENPFDESHHIVTLPHSVDDFTQAINLTDGYAAVFSKANSNHHRKVKASLKLGSSVIIAEDFQMWQQYYFMYQQSLSRWKQKKIHSGVTYNINFFKEVFNISPKYRKLWIAIVNDKPVAGILCFYWNKHAVVWHGAGLKDYFNYHPNDLVYNRAIQHACTEGYTWFDCNPSNGLDGVFYFKKALGSINLNTRYINKKSWLRRSVNLIRNFLK